MSDETVCAVKALTRGIPFHLLRQRKGITFPFFHDRLKINVWAGLRARPCLRDGIFVENDGSSRGAATEDRPYIISQAHLQIGE